MISPGLQRTLAIAVVGIALLAGPAWARGKIAFGSSGANPDRMTFKASGVPATELVPDADGLTVSLSNVTGLVFSETLPAGALVANSARNRWRYKAVRDGGIYDTKISTKTSSSGTAVFTVKVRLDADLAATDPARSGLAIELLASMTVTASVGDDSLSATAAWEPQRAGWRTKDDKFVARYLGSAKRVFASSECYLGSLGGLGGADEKCQTLADAAALGGKFSAWLADAYDGPSTRLPHATVPYVLIDGSVVARDWDDLVDGTILTAIDLDETGNAWLAGACGSSVWTNTSTLGTPAVSDALEFACYEWTLALFSRWGLLGDATATNSTWTDGGALAMRRCSTTARLYCFEP